MHVSSLYVQIVTSIFASTCAVLSNLLAICESGRRELILLVAKLGSALQTDRAGDPLAFL